MTSLRSVRTGDLSPGELAAIRALCDAAWGGPGRLVRRRRLAPRAGRGPRPGRGRTARSSPTGRSCLARSAPAARDVTTGYVEAVATWPAHQRRGHGTAVMRAVTDYIDDTFASARCARASRASTSDSAGPDGPGRRRSGRTAGPPTPEEEAPCWSGDPIVAGPRPLGADQLRLAPRRRVVAPRSVARCRRGTAHQPASRSVSPTCPPREPSTKPWAGRRPAATTTCASSRRDAWPSRSGAGESSPRTASCDDPGGWGGVTLAYNVRSPRRWTRSSPRRRPQARTSAARRRDVLGGYSGRVRGPGRSSVGDRVQSRLAAWRRRVGPAAGRGLTGGGGELGPGDEARAVGATHLFDDDVARATAAAFLADPRHHLLIATVDGEPAGFVSAIELLHPDKERPEMFIYELGVDEAFRRQGAASALLQRLLEICRERGCQGDVRPHRRGERRGDADVPQGRGRAGAGPGAVPVVLARGISYRDPAGPASAGAASRTFSAAVNSLNSSSAARNASWLSPTSTSR